MTLTCKIKLRMPKLLGPIISNVALNSGTELYKDATERLNGLGVSCLGLVGLSATPRPVVAAKVDCASEIRRCNSESREGT